MEKALHLLIADEEKNDCAQFNKALSQIPIPTKLKMVHTGEDLIRYLDKNNERLPDILFLDFNIPCMSGAECLTEIKKSKKLKHLPVIVYSTTLHGDVASYLYDQGAHYYIQKVGFVELKLTLHRILNTLLKNNFERPSKKNFVFNLVEA
jgi:response regulator RpfG family c-di-GMP phosphodiesterase